MFTRLRNRSVVALTFAALAGSLLTACGDDSDALVVYAGRSESLIGPLLKQFSDETGIELEIRYAGTSDHTATLLEEGDQTPADVFISQDAGALGALSEAGLLNALPAEITGAVKPDYTSADGTWVGLTGRARVIAYDSETLDADTVPSTVAELTDPRWKGQVGIAPANASFQAFVTGFRVAQGDDAAQEWLEDLVANDVQKFENNTSILEAVNNGALQLGLINHYYAYELAKESSVEVGDLRAQLAFPAAGDPGALVNVTGAAALSENPDALELIRYLISEKGQTYFTEETAEYPLVPGIPSPAGLPALESIEGPVENLAELADLETTLTMIAAAGLS